jgi:hypothetical protein
MSSLDDETGIPVHLVITCQSGEFTAKVQQDGHTLLDNQGERFMCAIDGTLEDALEELEKLASVRG